MKCPNCQTTTLQIAERVGIEIDHCPDCRGVWLDRGELDKIVERNREHDFRRREPEGDERGYRKRKSFLEDLFD